MTIEQTRVIDFISIDTTTDEVVLTISDHLQWDKGNEHFLVLQEKINSYLAFVETGEIVQSFPDAKGRSVAIHLVCKYPPSPQGADFLQQVTSFLKDAGFKFMYRVLQE